MISTVEAVPAYKLRRKQKVGESQLIPQSKLEDASAFTMVKSIEPKYISG